MNPHRIATNKYTGKAISSIQRIQQIIQDILTTRKGTRLMRPEYGSYIPLLIDSAMNDAGILRLKAAIATAIVINEPTLSVTKIQISTNTKGHAIADIHIKTNGATQPISVNLI